jgi:O-glycosyl hydrolase
VEWVSTIMGDPIASSYVHGTGLHWYAGDGYNYVDHARTIAPTKFLLATEACEGIVIIHTFIHSSFANKYPIMSL